ncbi:hypothetical protein VNO78_04319 [Psophocarpus tetragonolobus]|uniref:Uncharacterized protein n=1 Tax=Psophocarpus tetragonolobus TaxID=3891 RepID=A0AAN9T1R3_PSOTE
MEQNQSEDIQILNEKQFLKRTLQFVLSLSAFSVFVLYCCGFSIHPESFSAYYSTCLFSMFTHTLERKYMFLICNGILAFVAKTSLMNSSDSADTFDPLSETKATVSDNAVVPLVASFESPENVPLVVEEQKGQEENNEQVSDEIAHEEAIIMCTTTEGGESEAYITEEEEDEEGETESRVEVAQQDDLAETTITTNEDLVSTEELNRKFEEFIRKMKEEIRIEAQRQLIAV